jgi:hypothetical protein
MRSCPRSLFDPHPRHATLCIGLPSAVQLIRTFFTSFCLTVIMFPNLLSL